MSRSRSPWLWLPLVVLTMFFGVLGWHNAHMTDDPITLLVQCADFALMPKPRSSYNVLYEGGYGGGSTQSLVERLARKYPRVKFKAVTSLINNNGPYLQFFAPQFISRFHARCYFMYINNNDGDMEQSLTFARSPINLSDSSWHRISPK